MRKKYTTIALALLLALTSCGSGNGSDTTPLEPGAETQLTEAGLAQIEGTKMARFDLSDSSLTKESVGLTDDQVPLDFQLDDREGLVDLTLVAPNGELKLRSDILRFGDDSEQDRFGIITAFETFDTPEQMLDRVDELTPLLGVDPTWTDRERDQIGKRDIKGHPDPAYKLGISVQIEVRSKIDDPKSVIIYTIAPTPDEWKE